MQLQIEKLVNYLYDLYPDFWYYREWPCHAKTKYDVLLKNKKDWLCIKAFVNNECWKISYESELGLIQLFNTFSKEQKRNFLWPEILHYDNNNLFFIMKDIEFDWKKLLDFRTLNKIDVIKHFYQYRKVFDSFEAYCMDNWYTLMDIDSTYSVKQLIEKCKWWYLKWERIVKENNILLDFQKIESKILELCGNYWNNLFPRELSFKWFWTWHVFEWNGNYQLVDFDNVWYEIKWGSICRLACYCVILSVDNYVLYEERKSDFDWWKREMLKINEDFLVDALVLSSLIWVLYADYAGTMLTEYYNRELLENKWVVPEDNARKWMQWCAKLIREYYDI